MQVVQTQIRLLPGGGGVRGGGGGRLLVSLVRMCEQKKKRMRKGGFPFKLGSAQCCHHLGYKKNGILVGKGYGSTSLLKTL